jgi:hypothetical protein
MPRLFNVHHSPVILDGDWDHRAVQPGDPYDFSDEQVENGIGVEWSETDPRAGLAQERVWKRQRDAKPEAPTESPAAAEPEGDSDSPPTDPAQPGNEEESK